MKDQTAPGDANQDNANNSPGAMTRRKAIVGGMSGLLLGALSAKNAVAQGVPGAGTAQPLLQLGGVCQGTLMMLKPADSAAYMEKMLAKSGAFRLLRDYFVNTAGMAFILSRAKVFMYVAPSLDTTAMVSPNLIGILPSFKPVNRADAFHEAAGIVVHHNGGAMATSVKVSHNPFVVTEYRSHEVDSGDAAAGVPPNIVVKTISTADLERLSVQEAAAAMGAPKVSESQINPNSPPPSQADTTAMVTLALQTILKDSYARPLYPQEGLNSLLAQASLGAKLSSVHFLRYSGALSKGFWCSCTCSNGCTTCSITIGISVA